PAPRALVLSSGFFEILGGLGLLLARTGRLASFGLIALYIAVFPANIHMATHGIQIDPACGAGEKLRQERNAPPAPGSGPAALRQLAGHPRLLPPHEVKQLTPAHPEA
ncbi:MAG: hypothetical protein ABGY75_03380, partial [Gemmataceae bacterium]